MTCTIDFSIHNQVVNIAIESCEVYSARRRGTVLRILIRWGRLRLRRMLCLLRLRNLWPLSANPRYMQRVDIHGGRCRELDIHFCSVAARELYK